VASALPGDLAGAWVGFVLTLLVFTLLARDNPAARFAQHVIIGASLGFAGVVALQDVLGTRLLAPLLRGDPADLHLWGALALGVLLLAAGVERSLSQGRADAARSRLRRALVLLGRVPAALLLAVAVAAGLLGLVQGTLAPQTIYAVQSGVDWGAPAGAFVSAALTLLLAAAALLALTVERERGLRALPRSLQAFARLLLWIGERGLWLAAGFLFARLFASRLSLLIDRIAYFSAALEATGLRGWLEAIWSNLIG
jgi:hypothetical protein